MPIAFRNLGQLFATLEALAVKRGLMQPGDAPAVKDMPRMLPGPPEQARLPYKDPEEPPATREPGEEG